MCVNKDQRSRCGSVQRSRVTRAVSDNVAARIVLCLTVHSTHNPEIWTSYCSLANPNRGIVLYEFVPTGQTVNQVYYLEVLERLQEIVRQKQPKLFANNSQILHHDNAPAHMALSVREFLATKQTTVLEHPAYSPDLAPSDFFLFLKIKNILKGRQFDDNDDIRSNTTAALKAIPQNQFQNCFDGWTTRWHRCIASQGEYFEDDHGSILQWGM